jgi:hypothetical protein
MQIQPWPTLETMQALIINRQLTIYSATNASAHQNHLSHGNQMK